MMNAKLLALHAALVIFLFSCASPKKRGEEFLKKGAYEQAARQYEIAVNRDRNDAEAVAGLREARSKWIGQDLIEVRKARSSGNEEQALKLLMNLLQKQSDWKFNAGGSAVFTQEEEMGFAYKTVSRKLEASMKSGHALETQRMIQYYQPFFSGSRASSGEKYADRAQNQGASQCRDWLKSDLQNHPYFAEFLMKYCSVWKVNTDALEGRLGNKHQKLYRQVESQGEIKNLPATIKSQLEESLLEGLKKSAWFSAQAKNDLTIELSGEFTTQKGQNPAQLVHNYKIKEPYSVVKRVAKTRQVPFESSQNTYDPVSKTYKNIKSTSYRSETYYEDQPVTEYKEIAKTYPYGAWKHFQDLKLDLRASTRLDERKLTLNIHEKDHSESIQHDIHLPDIGLQPKKLDLPDENQWLNKQISGTEKQFSDQLNKMWSELYCQGSDGAASIASSGDRVHRCLAGNNTSAKVPASVDQWYEKHLGLKYIEANRVIGLY